MQGQDPRGFRLAVRARTRDCTAADVERAMGEDRSLLVTWLNRGTLGGIFRPFALVDGRAAATWTLRDGRVELEPFAPLPQRVARALDQEAADVLRFL